MAKKTGTATDYKDLLVQLRAFMTGTDVSPAVNRGWVAVRDTSTSSPVPSEYEMVFRGDGGTSPAKQIFFEIQTYQNSGAGYYNWEVRGLTGYGAGNTFATQPGISPQAFVPLQNTTMTYWFWLTPRFLKVIIKTGTAYQFMCAGFYNRFALDNEDPYPLLVMGSTHLSTRVYNSNAIDYASSINPGGDNTTTQNTNGAPGYLRFADGAWYQVKNFRDQSGADTGFTSSTVRVWPMSTYLASGYPLDNTGGVTSKDVRSLFLAPGAGGTPAALLKQSQGGFSPLFPATLFASTPSAQLLGEIPGVFWTHSSSVITAEDPITDTSVSPAEGYIAFKNIHRTDPWTFVAIRDN